MKVIYTKIDEYLLFGKFKLLSKITRYAERSREGEDSDDDSMIPLQERILKQ